MLQIIVGLLLIVCGAVPVWAQPIEFRLECDLKATDCVDMAHQDGSGKLRLQATPSISITSEGLKDASVELDQFGMEAMALDFSDQVGAQIAKLTEENVGKVVAIVANGEILTAPQIREKVAGGRIQISLGGPNKSRFWERLPWLNDRVDKERDARERKQKLNMAIYVTAAIVVVGGGLLFAFRQKKA